MAGGYKAKLDTSQSVMLQNGNGGDFGREPCKAVLFVLCASSVSTSQHACCWSQHCGSSDLNPGSP